MNGALSWPLSSAFVLLLAMAGGNDSRASLDLPKGPVTAPPHRSWRACTKDSACAATWLSCSGWIAINRAHESDMQHWYSRKNTALLNLVECSGPAQPPPEAVCLAHVCQLKP